MTVAYEHCVTMKHFRFRVINCIYLFPNVWVFEIYVWVLWKLRPRQTYKASLNVIIKCTITEKQTFWTKLFIFLFFSFLFFLSFFFLPFPLFSFRYLFLSPCSFLSLFPPPIALPFSISFLLSKTKKQIPNKCSAIYLQL